MTNTFISGARLYWECFENRISFFGVKGVSIPVAVSVFPDELYPAPRSWTEQAYPKLIYYNKVDKGGHFAAWEQPKLFSEEGSCALSTSVSQLELKHLGARPKRAPTPSRRDNDLKKTHHEPDRKRRIHGKDQDLWRSRKWRLAQL